MMKSLPASVAMLLIALLAIAGCGDSDSSSDDGAYGSQNKSATTASSESSADGKAAIVAAANKPNLGKAIVDGDGLTLYVFHKDKGNVSACYEACAEVWPPLLTAGEPEAGAGVTAAKLGTTERQDGTLQVTYAGRPLYYHAIDAEPEDASGNDISSFGAEWYALRPNGEEAAG